MKAICSSCGQEKDRPQGSCPACGQKPVGEERLVSWLLSRNHLSASELEEASARIADGSFPKPGPELLALARDALNPVPEERALTSVDPDAPMRPKQRIQLLLANVLLTPLMGLTLWLAWRTRRPVAAREALHLTWPVMLTLSLLWGLFYWARL